MIHHCLRMPAIVAVIACLHATPASADLLLDHAFTVGASRFVPMDIQAIELTLSLDAVERVASGVARIDFIAPDTGNPYFTMLPAALGATLDGNEVVVLDTPTPDAATNVRAVVAEVTAASRHTLELAYTLSPRQIKLRGGRVGFLTAMNDLGQEGNYFESYGPSNIEADAYRLTIAVTVTGASTIPRVFANGQVQEMSLDPPSWLVTFPDWYTTSSFYLQVTNSRFHVLQGLIPGVEKDIPVTVYSRSLRRVESAMATLPGVFAELEETYGPYVHDGFLALISGRGGMEHCGATVSSISALEHEVTHSWFGRGVMPSAGRDGWMDEAIASWRDYGYESYPRDPWREPTSLANFSVFDPFAPYNVYKDGRALLAELDAVLAPASGGLQPVLQQWFASQKRNPVSTEEFLSFLQTQTLEPLEPMFSRFVYGAESASPAGAMSMEQSRHPPRLSRREIRRLR